jgi:hypothetical protein
LLSLFALPIKITEWFKLDINVTNKRASARRVVAFHEGRGSQESIFTELKSHCQMDYALVTTRVGNQLYIGSPAFSLTI